LEDCLKAASFEPIVCWWREYEEGEGEGEPNGVDEDEDEDDRDCDGDIFCGEASE
jgi:hypothetical protein